MKEKYHRDLTGIRYIWPLLIVIIFMGIFTIDSASVFLQAENPWQKLILAIRYVYSYVLGSIVLSPWFYLGVPSLLVVERIWPVQRNQKSLGANTRIDLFYTIIMIPFYGLIAPLFYGFLRQIYEQYFWFINLSSEALYPYQLEILIGYLVIDFHGWLHHYVRHKVPVFWEFHTIHHSQPRMNPFTNERVHPFDWFSANVIKFLPAFFFSDALNVGLAYVIIHQFLDRFTHSNIRTNLGPLKYVLVTPQSHRVHHSNLPEHFDRNFGVSLSIWDYLFRTQHRNYEDYPETGIPDPNFPVEKASGENLSSILRIYLAQIIYPFKVVWTKTFTRS